MIMSFLYDHDHDDDDDDRNTKLPTTQVLFVINYKVLGKCQVGYNISKPVLVSFYYTASLIIRLIFKTYSVIVSAKTNKYIAVIIKA